MLFLIIVFLPPYPLLANTNLPVSTLHNADNQKIVNRSTEGNTLYVGPNEEYKTIKSAIDQASAKGDTIIVKPGTYRESFTIDKELTLKSEDGYQTTTIIGNSDIQVITITHQHVRIEGFTIDNDYYFSSDYHYDEATIIYVKLGADSCSIVSNKFGIKEGNIRDFTGIILYSNNNLIENNVLYHCERGIVIGYKYFYDDNPINNNRMIDNYFYNCGIYCNATNNSYIINNFFIYKNFSPYIYLEIFNSNQNTIYGNNGRGILRIEGSDLNLIVNNHFVNNEGLSDVFDYSYNNIIYLNSFVAIRFYKTYNYFQSPTKLHYYYENAVYKNFVGNYYFDNIVNQKTTSSGNNNNGIIPDPYVIDDDSKDNYPLLKPAKHFLPLTWLLNNNHSMSINVSNEYNEITIPQNDSYIWFSEHPLSDDTTYFNEGTWEGAIFFSTPPDKSDIFTIQPGFSTDQHNFQSDFLPSRLSVHETIPNIWTFQMNSVPYELKANNFLAFKIKNQSNKNYNIKVGCVWSYISHPETIAPLFKPVLTVGEGHFYNSIQHAINDASDGYTILVYEGQYEENLYIDKSIALISKSGWQATTIIGNNAAQYVIEINNDNVVLEGFSIKGSDNEHSGLIIYSCYCNIQKNYILNNRDSGIKAINAHENIIKENIFFSNNIGIQLDYAFNNQIFLNDFINSTNTHINSINQSENIWKTPNTNCFILKNKVYKSSLGNYYSHSQLTDSDQNGVFDSTYSMNGNEGGDLFPLSFLFNFYYIHPHVGEDGYESIQEAIDKTDLFQTIIVEPGTYREEIKIEKPIILRSFSGYQSVTITSSGISIFSNNVTIDGFTVYNKGIYLLKSSFCQIINNRLGIDSNINNSNGIILEYADHNMIYNNLCIGNKGNGIFLKYSHYNNVKNNICKYYKSSGIMISSSDNNTIYSNIFYENALSGINISSSSDNYNIGRNFILYNSVISNQPYGMKFNSKKNSTISLNFFDQETNITNDVLENNNFWNMKSNIYYSYQEHSFCQKLGNNYSDNEISDVNIDGIDDKQFMINSDIVDNYPLASHPESYSIHILWLTTDNKLDDTVDSIPDKILLPEYSSIIFTSRKPAINDKTFFNDNPWYGVLEFYSKPSYGHAFTVEPGYSTDGIDFISKASEPVSRCISDGTSESITFESTPNSFTCFAGKYLAIRISNNNYKDYYLNTGGAMSYLSCPNILSDDSHVDIKTPITTFRADGLFYSENQMVYAKSGFAISLSATDNETTVDAIFYQINNAEKETYLHTIIFDDYGQYKLTYYAIDSNGNMEKENILDIIIDGTPPMTPTDLNYERYEYNVELSWRMNEENDLQGYHIYRNNKKINEELLPSNNFHDHILSEKIYEYQITAIDRFGNESGFSEKLYISTRTNYLNITHPANNSFVHDNIITVEGFTNPSVPIQLCFNENCQWQSNAEPSGAFSISGIPSQQGPVTILLTAFESITTTDTTTRIINVQYIPRPQTPEGFEAMAEDTLIKLKWKPNPEPDIQGYFVYRNNKRLLYDFLPIEGTSFTDTRLSNGIPYTYQVTAINDSGIESNRTQPTIIEPVAGDWKINTSQKRKRSLNSITPLSVQSPSLNTILTIPVVNNSFPLKSKTVTVTVFENDLIQFNGKTSEKLVLKSGESHDYTFSFNTLCTEKNTNRDIVFTISDSYSQDYTSLIPINIQTSLNRCQKCDNENIVIRSCENLEPCQIYIGCDMNSGCLYIPKRNSDCNINILDSNYIHFIDQVTNDQGAEYYFSPQSSPGIKDSLTVDYYLNEPSKLFISIYSTDGKFIKSLIHNSEMPPGKHVVEWDGRDESGVFQDNGRYHLMIETNNDITIHDVVIDNEFPVAKIEDILFFPPGFQMVKGTISESHIYTKVITCLECNDENFFHYFNELSVASESEALSVTDDMIAYLNTMKLTEGEYTIQLKLADHAGNESISEKTIEINQSEIDNFYFTLPDIVSGSGSAFFEFFPDHPNIWLEDNSPTGSLEIDTWKWDTEIKYSGNTSHTDALKTGVHGHYFIRPDYPLMINKDESIIQYVYMDPQNPPLELLIQMYTHEGNGEHRAFWGENLIQTEGILNTDSLRSMGNLPETGQWIRLRISAHKLGLEEENIRGMAFVSYNGKVWWDSTTKSANINETSNQSWQTAPQVISRRTARSESMNVATIHIPYDNTIVYGEIPIMGTAANATTNRDSFDHFVLEYGYTHTPDQWNLLNTSCQQVYYNNIVHNNPATIFGNLGVWLINQTTKMGPYTIRLQVFDKRGYSRDNSRKIFIGQPVKTDGKIISSDDLMISLIIPENSVSNVVLVSIAEALTRNDQPVSDRFQMIGKKYDIVSSQNLLFEPCQLEINYHLQSLDEKDEKTLKIYQWNNREQQWRPINSTLNLTKKSIKSTIPKNICISGTYAILAGPLKPPVLYEPASASLDQVISILGYSTPGSWIELYHNEIQLEPVASEAFTGFFVNSGIQLNLQQNEFIGKVFDSQGNYSDISKVDIHFIQNETIKSKNIFSFMNDLDKNQQLKHIIMTLLLLTNSEFNNDQLEFFSAYPISKPGLDDINYLFLKFLKLEPVIVQERQDCQQ